MSHVIMSSPVTIAAIGSLYPDREPSWSELITPGMRRKDPRIFHMAFVAAQRTLQGSGLSPRSILAATALGALDETRTFLEATFTSGMGSPRNFISSVHNSMAGRLAAKLDVQGLNLTLCDGPNSVASALVTADLLPDSDFPVLLVAVEERIGLFESLALPSCSPFISGAWTEGAVAFLLTRAEACPQLRASLSIPLDERDPDTALQEMCPESKSIDSSYLPSEISISALEPALIIEGLLTNRKAGRYTLGAFSPSAKGLSIIELCM